MESPLNIQAIFIKNAYKIIQPEVIASLNIKEQLKSLQNIIYSSSNL